MGSGDHSRRLQARISPQTSFSGYKTHKITNSSTTFASNGNRKSFGQKSYRKSTRKGQDVRFLQYIVFGAKKGLRRTTSCHKSSTSKSVSHQKTFQNGHNVKSVESGRKRGLVSQSRLERCLFSYQNIQKTQKIPSIQFSRSNLPIQSNEFRTNSSPEGIYQDNSSRSCISKTPKHSVGNISRRLVDSESDSRNLVEKFNDYSQSTFSTRFHCQQKEIKSLSQPRLDLHRGKIRSSARSSLPNTRENSEFETGCRGPVKGTCYSSTLPGSVGENSILSGSNSQCQIIHETNSNSYVTELESLKNVNVTPDSYYSFSSLDSRMVVTESKYTKGSIFHTKEIFSGIDNRCQSVRMGGTHEWSNCTRSMVTIPETTTYQLFRDGSGFLDNQAFSATNQGSQCTDSYRQHDGCSMDQSSGRHEISKSLEIDMETLVSSNSEWHEYKSLSCCRQDKPAGRFLEQTTNLPDRVVIESERSQSNFQSVGSPLDGFVCHVREQESTNILHLDTPQPELLTGCPVNCVAEHVCLCFPTNSTNFSGTTTHETISVQDHSNCTSLAKTTLVSSAITTVGCSTSEITPDTRSVDTGEGVSVAPKSTNSKVDGMALVDRHFSTKGFSKRARKLLAASWRKGTKKDYNSKFRVFSSWCTERSIDPYDASLSDCADFLTDLFEKGLKYSTISGYRSMLSSVLPPVGRYPIGQNPFIIRLLKGVFNKRPPIRSLTPEWDLCIVLGCLKEDPFEPLKDAPLKFLTWKTVFLIAITTFRRCSDLQSLQLGEGSINIYKRGVTFIRTGLSKQDRPNHEGSHIFVPAFPENKLLDPKRCLHAYLKRTQLFRKNKGKTSDKLFLATKKPHQPVSSQTISKWIVRLIKFCYKKKDKTVSGRVTGHSTRSIGPTWALFKGASFKSVMDAADWSTETTFVKSYLKSMNAHVLQE